MFLRLLSLLILLLCIAASMRSQGYIGVANEEYLSQWMRENPEDGSLTVFSRFVSDHEFRRYSPEGLVIDTLKEPGYLYRPDYKFRPDGYDVFTAFAFGPLQHIRIFEKRNMRGELLSETVAQAPLDERDEILQFDKTGNAWVFAYPYYNNDSSDLIRIDTTGKEIARTKVHEDFLYLRKTRPSLFHLNDGGLLVLGPSEADTIEFNSKVCLVRLDGQANYLWHLDNMDWFDIKVRPDGKGYYLIMPGSRILYLDDNGKITATYQNSGNLRLAQEVQCAEVTPQNTLKVFGTDGDFVFVMGTFNEQLKFTEEFRQSYFRAITPRSILLHKQGGHVATFTVIDGVNTLLGVMYVLPNQTLKWRNVFPASMPYAAKQVYITSKNEVAIQFFAVAPDYKEILVKIDPNGKVPFNTYKAAGYWRDVNNCKSRGYQTLKEKLSVKDLSGAYLLRYADKGHRFEWKSTEIDANVAYRNSTDRFTYCKNPQQRIIFANIDQEKEDSIFMAPLAHCATIRYGAVLHDALPCKSTDLFVELSNEGNDITELLDVKVTLGDAYEGLESCGVPYADLGNKTYLLQVSELGEMGPGYLVRIPMKVKVSCAARENDNACVKFELTGERICEDEVFPEILPQKEQCAFVKESLPNETLRTFVAGKETARMIPAEGVLQFQVRFNNNTRSKVHVVTIRDTLPAELDITTFKTHLSSHDYNLQILNNNILIFTMRWLDLPDELKDGVRSQGYVAYTLNTKKGLAPGTIIKRSVGVYYDLTRVAIPGMELEIEGPSNAGELQKNGHDLAVYPQPSQGPMTVYCATCTEPQPYTLQLWNAHGQLVHRELLQQGRSELLVKTPGYYVLQISDAHGTSARQKVLVQP